MNSTEQIPLFIHLLPLLFLMLPLLIAVVSISLKKGKNPILWFFLCCIPLANIFFVLWLISQTDLEIKSQIKLLQEDLAKMKSSSSK